MRIDVDVNIRSSGSDVGVKLDKILALLQGIKTEEDRIMATLDEVLTDVQDESTVIDSLSTLTAGIKKQLDDALAGANLPPAVQAKVDAVFAGVEANKKKAADAILANTPAQPTP